MAEPPSADPRPAEAGLLGSFSNLLATLLALLQTRLELIAVEIEEEKEHIRETVLLALVALFCLSFALLLLSLFVVLALPHNYRLAALGVLTLLYLGVGIAALFALRAKTRARPPLFAATLTELDKDREHLKAVR